MAVSQLTTASLLHLMQEGDDPAKEIVESVGDLSEIELVDTGILVGIYIQQSKTKGGLITNIMSKASVFQGKVGLVLKLPNAPLPKSEADAWGGPDKLPKVGDWIVFNPDNGQQLSVHGIGAKPSERLKDIDLELFAGWPCRVVEAKYIIGRVKNPRSIV